MMSKLSVLCGHIALLVGLSPRKKLRVSLMDVVWVEFCATLIGGGGLSIEFRCPG